MKTAAGFQRVRVVFEDDKAPLLADLFAQYLLYLNHVYILCQKVTVGHDAKDIPRQIASIRKDIRFYHSLRSQDTNQEMEIMANTIAEGRTRHQQEREHYEREKELIGRRRKPFGPRIGGFSEIDPVSIHLVKISKRSPLELVLAACLPGIIAALVISGGEISYSSKTGFRMKLPAIGVGLEKLRAALRSNEREHGEGKGRTSR